MVFVVSGCSRAPASVAGPDFRPEEWFLGLMHSTGSLSAVFGKPHALHVDSTGRRQADGSLRLDQAIHWAGGSVDHRFWIMKPLPGGRYAVSLSDAAGPVAFEVSGPRAHLRYRDRHGPMPLMVEQWMDLRADGRALENHGTISVLGISVAKLDELIAHDPS